MPTPIYNITPFTLLDYPGRTACILWFAGCNMRCVYCYNPDIVLGKGRLSIAEALTFLRSRQGLLQGVVLSGGECTLHPTIFPLLETVKEYGFDVKIDTNGSRPRVLEELMTRQLVDYVALDFKALEHRFHAVTKSGLFSEFVESLSLLNRSDVSFEVRTTVHSDLIGLADLQEMVKFLQHVDYRGRYYIQHYVNGVPVLGGLGRSEKNERLSTLSTDQIQIVIRE
ncbi:anaerobic ribonucleoside-triphosphate reductase activating protein [Parapedobacter defluvii]|uniref:Anaerobic ribonucleoside-triphosphate reductase activating protein n=1 Tax=Parapedobacter defluvii TaxID=2045106 RepID=A0ABQ1LTF7_9SPHI|nr:anaerobic ribonucleoside-triphosphate reductase activating protein [Parapedobacter defluvii]GGC27894.1 anaerobic ribonucleoside-triphosphate reductase activating protein [Parapedobacter defluvii]